MARNLLRSFTSPSSLNPVTKIKNYFSIDRNLGPLSFFCSTATAVPSPTSSPSSPDSSESVPKDSLFARLVRVRKPKDSIPQVLQKWVDEGREVDLDNVRIIIKSFRSYKRYSYALRVPYLITLFFLFYFFPLFRMAMFILTKFELGLF